MRARVIIEYDIPNWERVALRDREEQRWITSETVLALWSATAKVEVIEGQGCPGDLPTNVREPIISGYSWQFTPPRLGLNATVVPGSAFGLVQHCTRLGSRALT